MTDLETALSAALDEQQQLFEKQHKEYLEAQITYLMRFKDLEKLFKTTQEDNHQLAKQVKSLTGLVSESQRMLESLQPMLKALAKG